MCIRDRLQRVRCAIRHHHLSIVVKLALPVQCGPMCTPGVEHSQAACTCAPAAAARIKSRLPRLRVRRDMTDPARKCLPRGRAQALVAAQISASASSLRLGAPARGARLRSVPAEVFAHRSSRDVDRSGARLGKLLQSGRLDATTVLPEDGNAADTPSQFLEMVQVGLR